MKSTTRLQNGNSGVDFDNNTGGSGGGGGDILRMNNSSSTVSGVAGGTSSASLINQAKAINLNQCEPNAWPNSPNGFVNGKTTKTALNQTKPYPRKTSVNGLDPDFDDDEKTNSFGLTRRVGGLSAFAPKNSSSNQLYIDEKNISVHMNNPFATDFVVTSSSLEPTMFNRSIDRKCYSSNINSHGTNSMPQSASTSQLSNVIKSQQLKNYGASGSNENGSNDYGRINDIDNNTLRNRPKRPHSIAGVLSPALLSSSTGSASSAAVRLSVLHQNKDELTSLITAGAVRGPATTTMTYSNSYSGPNNNNPVSNNGGAMKSSMNNTLNNVNNGNQNAMAQKVFNQPQNNEYAQQASTHVSYGHFINSPSRLTTNRQQASSQEFSLYSPPPPSSSSSPSSATATGPNATSINNGMNNNPQSVQARQPPPIVQRRSHSTPRPIQSTTIPAAISTDNGNKSTPSTVNNIANSGGVGVGGGVAVRPRSLDRAR